MAMVLSQFSSVQSAVEQNLLIPALLKHNQSKVAMVFDHGFTSALFETSHLIK
jgi:hypothetical protein